MLWKWAQIPHPKQGTIIILLSYIECDHGSKGAHHRKMGKDCHVGIWFLFYVAKKSTYAGNENMHWELADHVAPLHCSPPCAPYGPNEGQ